MRTSSPDGSARPSWIGTSSKKRLPRGAWLNQPRRLYPILDIDLCRERGLDPLATLDAFLEGGADLIQIRDKTSSTDSRLALADAVVARAHAAGARIVVNDRADIARLAGADGVHVGQDDLPVTDVRGIVGPEAIVGLSTHDAAQIEEGAQTTATYLAVGPVFGTRTKQTGYAARGLELVALAAATGKPVVAIGGITLERAPEVIAAGAVSVAVISDLLVDRNPAARVRAFLERLSSIRRI
jgi:thiamine-phosphate pyrophosphorylase